MENPFELILEKLSTIENLLRNDKNNVMLNVPPGQPTKDVLNVEQLAEYLNLSKSTIYKMTSSRIIPHSSSGKKLWFLKYEIDKWITQHKVKTNEEIRKEVDEYLMKPRNRKGR